MISGNPIIQMRNVSKGFGRIQALDGINLEISRGKIIGLLGANGAGKSTLLRHIIGLYLADEGQCITFGADAGKLGPKELGRIGYVHQEGELLLLAIGFAPELLILDEPASALDPIARSQFLDLLLQIIQDENRTIIISSHILSDVEKVIDHTIIMRKGRILRDSSFDSLREEFLKVTLTSLNGQLPKELPFENLISCERSGSQAVLTVQNYASSDLEAKAKEINCTIDIKPLSLEEIYKIVVNRE